MDPAESIIVRVNALLCVLVTLSTLAVGSERDQYEDEAIFLGDSVIFTSRGFEKADLDSGRLTVTAPSEFVEGFPMFVLVTVESAEDLVNIIPFDVSYGAACGVELSFRFQSGSGDDFQVGWHWLGTPSDEKNWPKSIRLFFGQRYTWVIDLSQLLLSPNYSDGRWSRLPGPGDWRMTAVLGQYPLVSNHHRVRVRTANQDESVFRDAIKAKGAGQSWFPAVIIWPDSNPMPDPDRLPPETRRIGHLIRVLRATVESDQAGLEAIEQSAVEWGYLQAFIDLVRCECEERLATSARPDSGDLLDQRLSSSGAPAGCFAGVRRSNVVENFRNGGVWD